MSSRSRTRVAAIATFALVACATEAAPPTAPSSSAPSATANANANSSERGDVSGVRGAASPSDAGADANRASDAEERRIQHMLARVAEARKLTPKRPVPGVVLDRPALLARVKAHVNREVPPDAIANEGFAMKLLGLVPTAFDYEAETYGLLEAQLAGYYEPADRTMYMAADLDGDNARATLAHELVHALQDQYWNLATRSKYAPGQGDLSATTSALAEGDATSAMFDVLLAKTGRTALDLPSDVFTKQIIESVSEGAGGRAPHAMRASLVAPYVYGTLFVNTLRTQGGWALVNRAWDKPPTTSEQILHPEKWRAGEAAVPVAAPLFASLGAGYVSADVDTFGELGTRLTLAEWMDESTAVVAAKDWGGDRATLVRRGDELALGWRVAFDDVKLSGKRKTPADRAFALVGAALDARLGRAEKRRGDFVCFSRSEVGPLGLLESGNQLIVVAGPTRSSKAGAWTSIGDCALSEKWAREIALAPLGP